MQRGMLQPETKTEGCRRDRTAGGYTWVKASELKERGTTRLSTQVSTGQLYFATAHCFCLPIQKAKLQLISVRVA